ncbi:MAG: riboflavin biosynthesis protein RibF [Bdellovibrionales bacterium RBG_16_40_8]|nr:MAG: riboflavin biosynthesis protein RibF [Bdellovibrionales bacterium RBG_16_40_8]
MQISHGLKSMSTLKSGCVLTIGNFDGVHLGHRTIISQLLERSRQFKVPGVVMTFDPHPSMVLRPQNPTKRLFSLLDLKEQLSELEVSELIIEPFTFEFSQISAQDFISRLIVPILHPLDILIGYDFVFGRNREGSLSVLMELAKKYSFNIEQVAPINYNNEVVSSTRIRKLIESGDVSQARDLLGRPYYIEGEVVRGEGRGEKLGYATANINFSSEVLPALGVYITEFQIAGKKLASVTNIGRKPTFHENYDITVETHVINAHENFYGRNIRVDFLKRLRAELKFNSSYELIEQIDKDVLEAKKYFSIK